MTTADGRTGTTVGKYRLHEVVGRGGMGVVYRAEHVYIGREVAVKILHEGYGGREESIKRFLREARAASLINHPNIVEVTDFGKSNDGTVFFVMELLRGEPLDAILARETRLDLLRSIIICNQLAAALAAAHNKGIIHRDLKPENVMLIPREGRRELVRRVSDESGAYELSEREKKFDFVKILDFGVAKVREPDGQKGRVTKTGVVFGTPEYMAPETARVGYSDARSDIYALGIMFYEMMTGTVPFTAESPVEVMMKQVNERVPAMRKMTPDAEITEDAERMILKALAKAPEERQQSMEEFHRDLQKCYGQLRFRRTLRTPNTNMVTTPPATTIPLTKKKKPGVPGAMPAAMEAGGSSPGEIETSGGRTSGGQRPRAATPGLPGLPLNATAPILLTKKKVVGSGATLSGAIPTAERPSAERRAVSEVGAELRDADIPREPDRRAADFDSDAEAPVSPDAITREIPKINRAAYRALGEVGTSGDPGTDGTQGPGQAHGPGQLEGRRDEGDHEPAARRDIPTEKKRTTLPLGLDEDDDRATPPAPRSVVDAPMGAATGEPHKGVPGADATRPPIGRVMIALPGRPKDPPSVPPLPERATPRVSVASGGDEGDARSWLHQPTTPSPTAVDYPDHTEKVRKPG